MVATTCQGELNNAAPTRSRRLLLVDDDPDIVRGTQLRLAVEGYEVLKAFDSGQCLALAASNQPDAILLDVRMPGRDGLETLAMLRKTKSTSRIPVIMLSGSIADEAPALDGGTRFFLRKPSSREALLSAIECATGKHQEPRTPRC